MIKSPTNNFNVIGLYNIVKYYDFIKVFFNKYNCQLLTILVFRYTNRTE